MNSVQRLRPMLMVLLMTVAWATSVRADDGVALTAVDQVPDGVEVRGKQVGAYTWSDKQGKNLVVLAEQVGERDDDGAQSAFVYAAQYLLDGDRPKRLWMLYDDVQHCELDAGAHFNTDATKVTDLLGDGISQVTVGYGASWWDEDAGALQGMPLPKDCSIAAQQALVSQFKEQGTELPLPGCYGDEEDFAKAPKPYLEFMRQ